MTEREYVIYKCGHRCYDTGFGGAPAHCPNCGEPAIARQSEESPNERLFVASGFEPATWHMEHDTE